MEWLGTMGWLIIDWTSDKPNWKLLMRSFPRNMNKANANLNWSEDKGSKSCEIQKKRTRKKSKKETKGEGGICVPLEAQLVFGNVVDEIDLIIERERTPVVTIYGMQSNFICGDTDPKYLFWAVKEQVRGKETLISWRRRRRRTWEKEGFDWRALGIPYGDFEWEMAASSLSSALERPSTRSLYLPFPRVNGESYLAPNQWNELVFNVRLPLSKAFEMMIHESILCHVKAHSHNPTLGLGELR